MSGESTAEGAAAAWYCPGCEREYPTSLGTCPADGTRLVRVTDRDPFIGQILDGRFVIRERLGAGGMGVVYRAWQTSVGREVAVKVIRTRAGNNVSLVKRFLREAKLSSQLSQPATVSVIDFGQTDDGTLYLVMELLRGRTLGELIAEGPLAPARAVRIATQICDALEAAHGAGIIHRDLKPANVMILDEPVGRDLTKVLDFGLAKAIDSDESSVTQSGRLVGTPTHLAPEVAVGGEATAASDLYALGVMLFEMLAGTAPFAAGEVSTMIMMHAYHAAPVLEAHVPAALADLVARLLAKRPADRPASAAVLRDLLEAAMKASAAPAPPTAPLGPLGPGGRAAGKRRAPAPADSRSDETRELGGATSASIGGGAAVAPAAAGEARPRRARVVAAIVLAAAVGVAAFVVVRDRRSSGSSAAPGTTNGADASIAADRGGGPVVGPPDAGVAAGPPIDAGVAADPPIDGGVAAGPPVDAAPVDAAPVDAAIDARARTRPDGSRPRPIDAGVRAAPIDAGRPARAIDAGTGFLAP